MSGASVSMTIAASGTSAATRRMRSARSKVSAPPKPSLKPSSTKTSACCGLPLKAWAMPPATGAAQVLQHRVDGAPHVQQHRQIELDGELELRREERRLAFRSRPGDEMVEADLADRDQPRVVAMASSASRRPAGRRRRSGRCTSDGCRARRPGRTDAPARAPLEIGRIDGRDDDHGDAGGAGPRDDGVAVGAEFGGVEMAMRVDPHGGR